MSLLVTGVAGFIGFHVAQALLARGETVIGIDNVNDYYDVRLKEARLARLAGQPGFTFARVDVADRAGLAAVFAAHTPDRVIHLAAQAGVRYSVDHPHVYGEANLVGFLNILEECRHSACRHLVYASSSSVYGSNGLMPFSETHGVGHPVSLYAATKRANEVMAHSYAHLYGFPTTGLRFFTVYGPWGRPDMALFLFTKAILDGKPIKVFNDGNMRRDFTYIDDIVDGVLRTLDRPPSPDPDWEGGSAHPLPDRSGSGPYRLYNIGRGEPVPLMDFVHVLEREIGRPAILDYQPMQQGDVAATFADTSALSRDTGYAPSVAVGEGVRRFVAWYREFYSV